MPQDKTRVTEPVPLRNSSFLRTWTGSIPSQTSFREDPDTSNNSI